MHLGYQQQPNLDSDSLPDQLFYSFQIHVCLWFLVKNKAAGKCRSASALELAIAA